VANGFVHFISVKKLKLEFIKWKLTQQIKHISQQIHRQGGILATIVCSTAPKKNPQAANFLAGSPGTESCF